jgi:hypothetical protein
MPNNPDPTNPLVGDAFTLHLNPTGKDITVHVVTRLDIDRTPCIISVERDPDGHITRRHLHELAEFSRLASDPADTIPEEFWIGVYRDDRYHDEQWGTYGSELKPDLDPLLAGGRGSYQRLLRVTVLEIVDPDTLPKAEPEPETNYDPRTGSVAATGDADL